jgi:hypothetical protein
MVVERRRSSVSPSEFFYKMRAESSELEADQELEKRHRMEKKFLGKNMN